MILKAPQQGFPVTADWGRSVVDAICRLRLRAGPGIKITQTPEGTTVSATQTPEGMAVAAAVEWPQWQCSLTTNRDGDPALYVGSGRLAWGGGHNATWQGRQIALSVPAGAKHYVVWYTKSAPIAYEVCFEEVPSEPVCVDVAAKDPEGFMPDVGSVDIFADKTRQEGWTDAHILATIERDETGVYSIEQIQVAEIAVNAVVYPGEKPKQPTPEDETEASCVNGGADTEKFPSDIDDKTIDWNDENGAFGDGASGEFPSKIGPCW